MNQFISFVRKEFYHIFRDYRTVLVLLGIPIVQIILFGFALTTEITNARLAVVDYSNDYLTQELKQRLGESSYFTICSYAESEEEVNRLFREGKIDAAIFFNANFANEYVRTGRPLLHIESDTSDPNSGQMIAAYAKGVMFEGRDSSIPLQIFTKLLYNPAMKGAYNFVPGVMALILLLICSMMTSISIVREKEVGTMEILLVSPVKPLHIIIAKMVPYFVLSQVNLTSILLLSVYVLDVPVAGSLWQLIVVSLIYIIVSLALGLLISTLVETQVAAMLFSGMVLMMPVVWFSGMMFPIENMPLPLQYVAGVLPARWYLSAVKKMMIQGLDITYAMGEVWVLIAMALLLVAVSLKKFNHKLS